MILYHGTSAANLDAILRDGIQPRSTTGRASNWDGPLESKAGYVYLTDSYPVFYAMTAAKDDEDLAIIKVRVKPGDLYPDEDYVSWVLAKETGGDQKSILPTIDITEFAALEQESLDRTGMVAVRKVTPANIIDHRIIDVHDWPFIMNIGGDSHRSPMTHGIMGPRYKAAVKALFRSGRDAAIRAMRWPGDDRPIPPIPPRRPAAIS